MGQRFLVSRDVSEAEGGSCGRLCLQRPPARELYRIYTPTWVHTPSFRFCSGRSVLPVRTDPAPVLCIPPFPAFSWALPRALPRG